ncbi:MAG: glycosyltransferase family 39 protein [Planctomycetota bacterium]
MHTPTPASNGQSVPQPDTPSMAELLRPHPSRRRLRLPLICVAVFVLAFAVRVAMASAFVGLGAPPDANANIDQVDFEIIAWHLAQGHGFTVDGSTPTARRALGAPLIFAPVYLITGQRDFGILRLWIIALSAATCVLTALIARRLAPPRYATLAAALAGLGLALYPGHAYYAMHMLSEPPFAACLALATYLSLLAWQHPAARSRQTWILTAAAGTAWALLILTKPQFILLLPLAAAALVTPPTVRWLRRRPVRLVQTPGPQLAFALLLTTLLVVPWGVRNHQQLGVTGLSSIVGLGLWGGNNELILDDPIWRGRWLRISEVERRLNQPLPDGEAAANREAKQRGLAFMRAHAAEMPALTLTKLQRLVTPFPRTTNTAARWSEALAWITLAPLTLLGLIHLLRHQRHTLALPLLLAPVVVTVGTAAVFFGIVRYRNALAPTLLVLGALGLASLLHALRSRYAKPNHTAYPLRTEEPLPTRRAA